jgi:zona occludens toxin
MLVVITGTPGSGKSYASVRLIAEAVEKGKPVATNVPLREGWEYTLARRNPLRRGRAGIEARAARYRSMVYVSEDVMDLLRVRLRGEGEGRGVLVLDEAHRALNARKWDAAVGMTRDEAIEARDELIRFFSGHRHYGFDVYILSQDEQNVDKQVRTLGEYLVRLKNVKRLKPWGIPLVPFNLFIAIWVWNDKAKTIAKRQVYFLNKSIAGMYHTHALQGVDMREDAIWLPHGQAA